MGVVEDGMPDRQRRNQNHRKLLVVAKDRDGALSRHQRRAAWLFLFIPGVLFVLFTVVPFMVAAVVSLTDYSIVQSPRWIGLSNYAEIVRDPFFWTAIRNTVFYTLLFVPLGLIVALGAALLLNRNVRIAKLFRTLFYVPVVSSTVATATIWYWVLNPQKGLLNAALGWFGIQGPAWLYDSHWAMIAIVIMNVWAGFGTNMIIFLGGLQGVPNNLREAARLDGANAFQVFWHVVLPSIRPTLFLVTTQLIISAFQVFDQAYILTKGGPGNSTVTVVYYIYDRGFGALRMGYASALSFVLFAIIFVFSLINMRITNKEES
ncbi:carbohydrate ABC transporter permease [Bifidobacterium scardovii]|uniref:Sugar ABC transporter permease n=1 Tax=Bifidobacterium scardovii TaxID=158787 RepID=A0A087D3J8_9BIFI|nr:sugar ABC transporter permease [Bifidobacterium scardovii]KFI90098.1 sugar ABC transporter permease [Bifidobacterium scardovii]MDK6349210.1 sugar ABC transporter permease [Bifidobacterium scardovii]MDU8980749.1 sugar ABC transporter permease [Bifidobacterium scardovii]BAQ32547.1 sugar ABC transporter permease component [Bifidobacterium scardovii JCM 12489 = DSM 13734]